MFVSSCHTWRRHCCEIGSFHAHECSAGSVDETELMWFWQLLRFQDFVDVLRQWWRRPRPLEATVKRRFDLRIWDQTVSVETSDPVHDITSVLTSAPYRATHVQNIMVTWPLLDTTGFLLSCHEGGKKKKRVAALIWTVSDLNRLSVLTCPELSGWQICSGRRRRLGLTTSWRCTTPAAACWTSPPSWRPTARTRTTGWRWWRRI